ncbi:uncharacterized protein MELLADRAFT_93440 [Melampsora larici-populina 98AG31]|uniref:Amine oxidase domain-containing protein n=1 Tax=Melampsora larici-populina (strain 98AG31 / pathotype 3-4-7) TaxID=747676 RepID=F4RAE0_MELLP|nr:uncharacterized protein MELLADRAFT_93440 [Melampsora larici-populina 98AG31]EGG10464.1 hypothetical protein MELLADRAFT_93440 [Melampsora larici-populina 98AG31]
MASSNTNNKSNSNHTIRNPFNSILKAHELNQFEISELEGTHQVVIIGAGMAGLSAALKLAKLNYKVIIVEARDRVGGRIETREFQTSTKSNDSVKEDPSRIDLGASFLHGIEGNPLIDLMKEYKQPVHFENEESPMKIYSFDGPALPDKSTKKLIDHAYLTFFESARNDAQASETPDSAASLGSYLYDPQSPLFNVASGPEDRSVLAHLVGGLESWTGAALEQVSLRWWGFEREFNGKDGVVTHGYGVLVNLMAQEFIRLGGKIILGYECLGLEYDLDAGLVKTLIRPTLSESLEDNAHAERIPRPAEEAGSKSIQEGAVIRLSSDYTVCTLPLGVLKSILVKDHLFFNPPLPARRCQAIERIGFGLLNKVILRYDHAWWPIDAPCSGSTSSDSSSGASTPSSVSPFHGHLPNHASLLESTIFATSVKVQNYVPITGEAALVFFFGASAGEAIEELSDQSVSEMMHAKLVAHLDDAEEDDRHLEIPEGPSECIVTRWRKDRFSLGSYAFIPPFSKQASNLDEPATPLDIMEMNRPLWNGRLGWAGEHCQVDHYACVHGPHLSGLEEAERIHVAIQANTTGSPSSSV